MFDEVFSDIGVKHHPFRNCLSRFFTGNDLQCALYSTLYSGRFQRKSQSMVRHDTVPYCVPDMSSTQLKPYYGGIFEKFVFLLQTIHIYVENTWAKFETISSMTHKANTKSRYVQEKQRILS